MNVLLAMAFTLAVAVLFGNFTFAALLCAIPAGYFALKATPQDESQFWGIVLILILLGGVAFTGYYLFAEVFV